MTKRLTDIFIGFGILNLCIVAIIGVLMRYKIGFEFPYFEQRNLLHAHSHFAFSGWITHILYTLLVTFLKTKQVKSGQISHLIWANLVCAFGMLISFTIQGYGPFSILFSTVSILVSYVFSYQYFIALKEIVHPSKKWFKAALFFNILSSLGTIYLSYMMVSKNINQQTYLGSVYFYLHFQYSGWFFFAVLGLLMAKLHESPLFTYNEKIFRAFFIACIPAFILSILWAKLPGFIYIFPVIAVVLQLYGLWMLIILLKNNFKNLNKDWTQHVKWILGLAFIALIIKLCLQAGSIFPEISKLAFGFRSIVIAYLHLVLLAFITLFLLGYLLLCGYIKQSKLSLLGLVLFSIGVFANEFVLMIQGIASFGYVLIPYLNETLFGISIFMFLSLILLLFTYRKI